MVAPTPRPPSDVSLVDLLNSGMLRTEDVADDGRVDAMTRVRAEREYAEWSQATTRRLRSPQSQAPSPSVPPARRLRLRPSAMPAECHSLSESPPRRACCVCYARRSDHAIVPCFHLCVCRSCAERLERCPICRMRIDRVQRIFIA